jgi:eukaryotic-like serine/threonine-protein kinase
MCPQDRRRLKLLPVRYRVLGELARGGMGVVYRAVDRRTGSEVAIKTLPPGPCTDVVAFKRFKREATTVASLHHPNVCQVFNVDSFRGRPYIVMELLAGETVKERVRRGPGDTALTLTVAQQAAAGLAAAHDRSIIHRDVTPANVFITSDGDVKLLDFGLAKHFAAVDAPDTLPVTRPGFTPGTVHYMSPEQLRGGRLDQRTDLYSLGVTIYELLTGRRPFMGATALETIAAILYRTPPPLPSIPFSSEWTRVLDRLLAKDRDRRYRSATELQADLAPFERVTRGERASWPRRVQVADRLPRLSLAIVPFKASYDRRATVEQRNEVDYFCHNLVDAVTVGLSRLDGLRVVPRTLASRITRRGNELQRLGQELHAHCLVTGAVQRDGDRFIADILLFDVTGNAVMWTKKYDVSAQDLFHLRDQVVSRVAEELRLVAAAAPRSRRVEAGSREAFLLCLKGRFFWSRRYEDGLLKALKCFGDAIKLDPRLALAHAGLADTFSFLGFYSLMRPRDAFASAATHAREALRLDATLAEAHTSLGLLKLGGDWDWEGAISEFRSALRLDPTQSLARIYLSWAHVLRNEIPEAHSEAERAQDVDPLSPIFNAGAAYTFFLSRSYERAIRECEKALEIDQDFLVARYVMALCKGELGHHNDAIRDLELAVKLSGGMIFYLALLGKMYADTRKKPLIAKAKTILKTFDALRKSGDTYVGPHAYVYVYAGLGDLDKAFAWQAKAFKDGASPFNYLSPQLGVLHGDPRFLRDLRAWNVGLRGPAVVRIAPGPLPGPAGPAPPA